MFANIDKSNVGMKALFLRLSMDRLGGNDCPVSIFSGLGGSRIELFRFWAVIAHILSSYVIFHAFLPNYHPPLLYASPDPRIYVSLK